VLVLLVVRRPVARASVACTEGCRIKGTILQMIFALCTSGLTVGATATSQAFNGTSCSSPAKDCPRGHKRKDGQPSRRVAAERGRPQTTSSKAGQAVSAMRLRSWLTVCWALLPAVSLGLLAVVPALHAAFRLRRRSLWAIAIAYGLLTMAATTLMGRDPNSGTAAPAGTRDSVGVALLLGGAVVATVHAFMLRAQVFPSVAAMRAPLRDDPAVAAAVAAAQRRQHAHTLADRDPALARDLRIGRPDLPREFDDGGLVDVNHVPAPVLTNHLGLSAQQAEAVVQAREQLGGFATVAELEGYASLDAATVDALADRIILLRY
jgi:DNA uptake protein ComE-like DNA-binding protein